MLFMLSLILSNPLSHVYRSSAWTRREDVASGPLTGAVKGCQLRRRVESASTEDRSF